MGSSHRLHYDLYRGQKILTDPGDAGTITVSQDLQICEMVSGASNETRTLTVPTKPGIRFLLRLKTHGGGNVAVTSANGFNAAAETEATFDAANDFLSLISVSTAAAYRWEIMEGNVSTVISSASPSNTPSTSPSTSPSSSPSASPSTSPSTSPSSSPSAT